MKFVVMILTCLLDITGTELLEAIFKLEEEKSTSGNLSERPNDQSGTNQSTSQKPTHNKGQSTDPGIECNYVIYIYIYLNNIIKKKLVERANLGHWSL
jgi:hypothetical protein